VALRLISDILDMERIAEGKFKLQLKTCNIGSLIRHAVENSVHEAAAKNILLRGSNFEKLGDANIDHDRIMQVLGNLIGNALKFTPEGGTVQVHASTKEDRVQISVSDTGPGIPDDKTEMIFNRFAQLKSADRRGLGLGLYISKMFVEAHQGELWVDSKLGQGSTFSFSIPRNCTL
jgi:signal transduction histidine kinase